ncbi:MAG: 50S ribosomal protein L3 [Candidatus Methanofastidiosia archaeon]
MGRKHRPRRGSLAYSPRKRAKSQTPKIKRWKKIAEARVLDFPGYKAGMTHILKIDDRPYVLSSGKEIFVPCTIVETPPVYVCAVRAYKRTQKGLKVLGEIWAEFPSDLERVLIPPKKKKKFKFEDVDDVRVVVCTQPRLIKLKKKPELLECGLGGENVEEKLKYSLSILSKEITINDVFKEGDYIDVSSVTKGKGFQGVVKRWGVKIQSRKTNDMRRHVGSIGPWSPHKVMWTVPFAGQMGYQSRTEINKRILKINEAKHADVTPNGGFLNYGILRSYYALIKGSIPGPSKRLVRMRGAIRPPKHLSREPPRLTYISKASKQGV